MKIKSVLKKLNLTQRDILRYVNKRFERMCDNQPLSESQMSKICTGFQRPTPFARLMLMEALAHFGLSDRSIFRIEELQELPPKRKEKPWR